MLSRLSALDVANGAHREGSPTAPVAGSRTFPDSDFPNNATTFVAIKQLQRPGRGMRLPAVSLIDVLTWLQQY
jgi:hypothetical protein